MILKGSQRGHGADLAIHLMNACDNESIEIAQVRGAVAQDLLGAFAEFEAVCRGTKAREYLYSLSISPPSPITREQYFEAIDLIGQRLGLGNQPRAVVFHIKEGREHCHVVWSRIDTERMRAIHLAHDRRRLMDLACELSRKFGLPMPEGLKNWEAREKKRKEKLEPTLAEQAQAADTGITPEQRAAEITAAYEASDTAEAFQAALEQKGYILARGDKRALIVVDRFGNPHSLTRHVKGHKASTIKKKLAALDPERLPTADQAKEMARQRALAREEAKREQASDETAVSGDRTQEEERIRERLAAFRRRKEEDLALRLAARRLEVQQAEQELLSRQQHERLSLHAAQKSESRGLLFRVRRAVAHLIERTPGLCSVLGPVQKLTGLDPAERHRLESEALARRHAREKLDIERRRRMYARLETRERQSLERALRRAQRLEESARLQRKHAAKQAHAVDNKAMQDFFDAARDLGLWRRREFEEGEVTQSFNDAAGIRKGPGGAGGDADGGHRPDDDPDTIDDGNGDEQTPRPRRRKGFGHGRN